MERVAAAAEAGAPLKRDFVFTARAENFLHGRPDLDDTIRRLLAFQEVGADGALRAGPLRHRNGARLYPAPAVTRPVNVLAVAGFSMAELAAAA